MTAWLQHTLQQAWEEGGGGVQSKRDRETQDTETESNLVFYAQSTTTVTSARERGGGRERERERGQRQTDRAKEVCSSQHWWRYSSAGDVRDGEGHRAPLAFSQQQRTKRHLPGLRLPAFHLAPAVLDRALRQAGHVGQAGQAS